MNLRFRFGLRVRLVGLVLLAVLPAFALIVYTGFEQRRVAARETLASALDLARRAAEREQDLLDQTRHLLIALAQTRVVREHDRPRCNELFERLIKQYRGYVSLAAVTETGDVFCSSQPPAGPVNLADRTWFQQATAAREFAVGDFVFERISRKPSVGVGYPILDDRAAVRGVVSAGLDLDWLGRLATQAGLAPDVSVTLVDRAGTVFARVPEAERWVGKTVRESPLIWATLTRQEGAIEAIDLDGRPRVFGLASLGADRHAVVAVGIPRNTAFAPVNRVIVRNILLLALVATLALVAAWVGGDWLVLRRVRALMHATRRLAAGDLSARAGGGAGRGELDELARTFDRMADALEQRQHRLQTIERLNRLISSSLDLTDVLTAIAKAAAELTGAPAVNFWLADEGTRTLTLGALADPALEEGFGERQRTFDEVGIGWVATHHRTLDIPDVFAPAAPMRRQQWFRRYGLSSMRAAPVFFGDTLVAVLVLCGRRPFKFSDAESALLQSFSAQAAIAIRNAQLFEETEIRAHQTRVILDTSTDAFVAINVDGIITDWNRAAEATFGWSRDEAIGRPLTDTIVPLQHRAVHVRGLLRFLSTGEGPILNKRIELTALHRRGHEFPIELTIWPVRVGEIRTFNAFVYDITERKRAENALRAAEERYRLLFERNLAGIFRSRRDGRVLECNDALARILGYPTREEVLTRNATEFYANPGDRERLLERLGAGQAISNVEFDWRRRDGTTVPVLVNVSEVAADGASYLDGTVLEISDRKRIEAAERQAQALRSVAQLANAASHEINNPLTVMTTSLELLAKRIPGDEVAARNVERALTASRRITEMISLMGKITRLEIKDEWEGLTPMLDLRKSSEPPDEPSG